MLYVSLICFLSVSQTFPQMFKLGEIQTFDLGNNQFHLVVRKMKIIKAKLLHSAFLLDLNNWSICFGEEEVLRLIQLTVKSSWAMYNDEDITSHDPTLLHYVTKQKVLLCQVRCCLSNFVCTCTDTHSHTGPTHSVFHAVQCGRNGR